MTITTAVAQHLASAAPCTAAVPSWNDVVVSGYVVAANADAATGSAKTRTAIKARVLTPTSFKRTAQVLIPPASPPV